MPVYEFLTRSYAMAIYLYGTRTFASLSAQYVQPVKQYAADTFTNSQLDNALAQGYISQQEHDDTMGLKGPEDPTTDGATAE